MNVNTTDRLQGHRVWLYALLAITVLVAGGCATTAPQTQGTTTDDDPKDVQQALLNGDKALQSGDLDRAIFEYVRALQIDPENVEALYKMGAVNSTKGNLDVATTSYRRVLALEPGHTGALEGLGVVLLRERKYEEAKKELISSVAADPDRWQAQNGLGIIFDLKGDYSRAEQHYQAALKSKPRSAMVLNNIGYNRYLAGKWRTAEEYFRRALAIDSEHQKAWSNLGLVYARRGHYPQALNAFGQIMDKPQALNNVGYLCMLDGKHEDAERFFNEAIKQSPSYYKLAYENLAQLQAKQPSGLTTRSQDSQGHSY